MANRKIDIFEKVRISAEHDRLNLDRQIRTIFLWILTSIVSSFLIYHLCLGISGNTICLLTNEPLLFYMWPQNSSIIDSLATLDYAIKDKCLFIFMRSTMSFILFLFVIYALVSQFWSADRYYTSGMILPFLLMLIAGLVVSFLPIAPLQSKFLLSATSPMHYNIVKSAIVIHGIYFVTYMLIFRISAYIRSQR